MGGTAPPISAPTSNVGGGSLPYPTAGHGTMPVPYGAVSNTPYPTYQPPAMPQGYNPYGMPYPSKFPLFLYTYIIKYTKNTF